MPCRYLSLVDDERIVMNGSRPLGEVGELSV